MEEELDLNLEFESRLEALQEAEREARELETNDFSIETQGGTGGFSLPTTDDGIILGTEGDDEARDFDVTDRADNNISALAGNDTVVADFGTNGFGDDTVDGGDGNDNIAGTGGDDSIIGGSGNDFLQGDSALGDDKNTEAFGDDTLKGEDGSDTLWGSSGDDSIDGGQQNDSLEGDDGNDDLRGSGGDDRIEGGTGDDVLKGSSGNDYNLGQEGNDTVYGGSGNDKLYGDRVDDLVGGFSSDMLFGDWGDDTLYGGEDSDLLDGGDDSDRLIGVETEFPEPDFGRSTIDTLTGGSDDDTFVIGQKNNVFYNDGNPDAEGTGDYALITDYQLGIDRLDVAGSENNYSFDLSSGDLPDGLAVYHQPDERSRELIAVLEGDFSSTNLEDISEEVTFI